jgi:hypothetical protein
MHDIIRIDSTKLTQGEDIEMIAILENMDASIEAKQPLIVPTVAPVRCRTFIRRSSLPHWLDLRSMTCQELTEAVNRYTNLNKQEWEVLVPKFRDHNPAPK